MNCGALYLLILHNSGCRRIKVRLLDTPSMKNARNCMKNCLENPPKCTVLTKNLRNFKKPSVIIICVKPQSQEFRHAYA
jgi:hypothetical protein